MSWASRRKSFLIIFIFLGLFIVVASIIFYSQPAPSCSDKKQNQDEKGIDCGGSCKAICQELTIPLKVEWVRPFQIASGVASVAAYVTNPNAKLGAPNVPYIFRLY